MRQSEPSNNCFQSLSAHCTCKPALHYFIFFFKEKRAQDGRGHAAEVITVVLQLTLGRQENVHQDHQHYRPNPTERWRWDKSQQTNKNIKGGLLHRCKSCRVNDIKEWIPIFKYEHVFKRTGIMRKQREVKSPVSVKFSLTRLHGTTGYVLLTLYDNYWRSGAATTDSGMSWAISPTSLSFIRTINVPCGSKNGRHADSTQAGWKTKLNPKYNKLAGRENRKSIQKLRSNTQTQTRVRCRDSRQENRANTAAKTGLVLFLYLVPPCLIYSNMTHAHTWNKPRQGQYFKGLNEISPWHNKN